jgi:hypothetical protein
MGEPSSERAHPGRPSRACSAASTIARHGNGTRTRRKTRWPSPAASCAAGAAISIRGRLGRPMASYGPMSTVVYDIGWYNAPEAAVGVSIVRRRSTCTTRSGSTTFPAGEPTCRERRLDGTRESRMRAICMSGLMSGDWKRTYGANCDIGVSENGRKQPSLATYGHRASRRLYPSRIRHPELNGSRRATPTLLL